MMVSYSVFHIDQKMEFEKFSCFFVDFSRFSFGRIKVISTVAGREYTPGITRQICAKYYKSENFFSNFDFMLRIKNINPT